MQNDGESVQILWCIPIKNRMKIVQDIAIDGGHPSLLWVIPNLEGDPHKISQKI